MNTPASHLRRDLDAARRMSHGQQLARIASKYPRKVGFVSRDRQVTFEELHRRVNRLCRTLQRRGVSAGDRVAWLMTNSIENVETIFAICRLGAIAVPINLRLAPAEIEYQLNDSGARAIVTDQKFAALIGELRQRLTIPACLVLGDDPAAAGEGADSYGEAVDLESDDEVVVDVDEHAPAFILYTSGTTGRPKGAVMSHFSFMMSSLNAMVEQNIASPEEIWYGNLPNFHISGLAGIFPYMMCGGSSVIIPLGEFDAAQAIDDLEQFRITAAAFVPAQWQAICARPDLLERDYNLRRLIWGTSQALIPVLEKIARAFPDVPVYNFFGQTEMTTTCVLPGRDLQRKIGSVGKPIVNVEARIVDEAMRDVPQGEVGEIVYRGPTTMLEYWKAPEATAEAFEGGWFHSGDLCRMDEEGYIYVVDRKKDMIISGGENIYSAEVEQAILAHEAVREVAVIGVPHEKWGETPVAVVVPSDSGNAPSEAEIIAHVKTLLASYKKPSRVHFVEQMPRNATGKIVKPRLRERFGTPVSEA